MFYMGENLFIASPLNATNTTLTNTTNYLVLIKEIHSLLYIVLGIIVLWGIAQILPRIVEYKLRKKLIELIIKYGKPELIALEYLKTLEHFIDIYIEECGSNSQLQQKITKHRKQKELYYKLIIFVFLVLVVIYTLLSIKQSLY